MSVVPGSKLLQPPPMLRQDGTGMEELRKWLVLLHQLLGPNLQTLLTLSAAPGKGIGLLVQAETVNAPAWVPGSMYYDLTLGKLRVGGATGWETVTSS